MIHLGPSRLYVVPDRVFARFAERISLCRSP